MFTNPLNRKYQTGGSAPTDDQKKDMQEFVTWIKSNVEGFKDKSEQEIVKSLSDMAKSDEGKKSVQDLYSRYQKSKKQKSKFADGGKFQDFICKHARGGAMDCGCGGTVIRGEDGIPEVPEINPDSKQSRQVRRSAKRAQDLNGVTRRSTSYIETPEGKWGFEQGDVNGNTTETYFFAPNRSVPTQVDTPWVQKIYTPYGYRIVRGNQNSAGWTTLGPRIENILSQEDGGVLKGQDGLSRKQIRQDKRKVLRAMNRPTAGAQYEDLVNKTRNWDRFAGMSRLERKNAINQLILNGEKPVVQTPYQPDLGENYVINETTVPYQFFNPTPEVVETPKVETVTTQTQSTPTATIQRSTSTNRSSNIAKPEDFPVQEIVIPQISTNIPFGNGSRTVTSNNSMDETRNYQPENTVMRPDYFQQMQDQLFRFGPTVEWGEAGLIDDEGNRIIKDEGNGVYWTRDAEGRLQKHEPVRTATIATSTPRRNYSAITGQPLRNGQSTWDLFKQGGKIEKHQDANGKIATSNVTPVGKVTQIRFPKILFGPGHNTVSFKSDDGLVHTWTRYDDGIYAYNSSPSYITKIYSPKAKETKNVRDGLKHTTITYPIDSTLTQKVDALIDDNTKWWK